MCSSTSTWSACVIQPSRRSLISSAIRPSPKLSWARRSSIIVLPPALARALGPQHVVIELADRLDHFLQLLIVLQIATNLGHPLAPHALLPLASPGIAHRQHRHRVTFSARAARTTFLMAHDALQQRAAQQLARDRQLVNQLLARSQ